MVADTSGHSAWMSGRSSRTCFMATAIWFSPWKGTSPVSISEQHDAERVDVGLAVDVMAEHCSGET